jgi:hypothetical protein
MFKKLLKGTDLESQAALDKLFATIPDDPQLLWYPSAGNDYRDLLEMQSKRCLINGIKKVPDLHIHTDYNLSMVNIEGIAYQDERTTVSIVAKHSLAFTQPVHFEVNPAYITGCVPRYGDPLVYLLEIEILSKSLGKINDRVLYFFFENINFLERVLLPNHLNVSHLVKVREGCGFGGNNKSIAIAYAFLSELRTQYLIIDTEEHTDFSLIRKIQRNYHLDLKKYSLLPLSVLDPWSCFQVKVFAVEYEDKHWEREEHKQILALIRERMPLQIVIGA